MKKIFAIVLTLIITSACGPLVKTEARDLTGFLPEKYEPRKIKDSELSCVADFTYRDLSERDKGWSRYSETLRTIIESTKK